MARFEKEECHKAPQMPEIKEPKHERRDSSEFGLVLSSSPPLPPPTVIYNFINLPFLPFAPLSCHSPKAVSLSFLDVRTHTHTHTHTSPTADCSLLCCYLFLLHSVLIVLLGYTFGSLCSL